MNTYAAIDPHDETIIREIPVYTLREAEAALADAEAAFQKWKQVSFSHRAEVLRNVAAKMEANVESLAMLMTEEMGKPIREARAEVKKAAWCAVHYAEHAQAYLADQPLSSDASESGVTYRPLGPVLGILPWNAPIWLAFRFLAPTLMAGNSCVFKHDPHVPGCAQAIAELFAGYDEPIVTHLPLANDDVAAVINNPRIHGVSFTGSVKTGSIVAGLAGAALKPSVLELGGSDPAIVLADADLEKAAKTIALSRIINAGQSCIAAKRIIVESQVHDHFVELLSRELSTYKMGNPRSEDTGMGPLARHDIRENLHRQVSESITAGATRRMGGDIPSGKGFYYPITLLTEVTNEMPVCREETFGPVASILRVTSADEAIHIANDTEYGLAASIWTETTRGKQLLPQLNAGQVVLNGIVKTDPRLPSGGIKRSGYGRELGPHGIHAFVNPCQYWIAPCC